MKELTGPSNFKNGQKLEWSYEYQHSDSMKSINQRCDEVYEMLLRTVLRNQ